MAKKEVLINVTVQATDGINALNQVNKSLNDGAKAASDMGNAVNQALQPIKGSVADLQSQVSALERARAATATTSAEYKKQGIEIDKLNIKIAELSGAKGLGSVNSAAGIAGATVNEFGRFVSDLPFGIIAVTNNLSQMGSLFAILVGQASQLNNGLSTTANVIGLLKAQFLGPAGILFVFQAVVSAITLFAQRSKEAENELKGLSSTLKEQTVVVRDLLDQYLRLNDAQDGRAAILNQLKKIDEDLYRALSEGNKTEEERIKIIEAYNKLTDLSIQKELKYGDLIDERLILQNRVNEVEAEILRLGEQENISARQRNTNARKINDLIAEKNELLDEDAELSKQVNDINKELSATEEDLASRIGLTNDQIKERAKLTKDYLGDLRSSRIELLQAEEGGTEEEQVDRLNKIRKLQEEELLARQEAAMEKAIQDGIFFDLDNELFQTFANERKVLELEYYKTLLEVRRNFNKEVEGLVTMPGTIDTEPIKKAKSELDDLFDRVKKRADDTAGLINKKKIEEATAIQERLDKIAVAQELANNIFDITNAQYDKELILEQNKTVEMNNQLKERLRNEQLSAEERKSIQNQIAKNDEALRKKQEAIEEKRFKLNKAASLANAVVNTYLAATAALKDPALSTFQRIASMVAIIGAGLAQVAVIAKQRFIKSDAGGAPGISSSASAPTAIQAPAFNVVGQSNASQLADVVRGQLDRPVKTYVVASEVTTAQALERNRVNAASI
jgi:hypothetical protein